MIANQNAYEILGLGVITIADLDSCGLSITADAIIKKVFFEILEKHHEAKLPGEDAVSKAEEITSAYSQISNYADRLVYNDFMKSNGFSFGTSSNNIKEASALKQFRQVSFDVNLNKFSTCQETRQLADYWGSITTSTTNSNSYSPHSYYDDSESCSSPSEEGDQACQDCEPNCAEPIGCGWFVNQQDKILKNCGENKIGGFITKIDINSIFKNRKKVEKPSREMLQILVEELQEEKVKIVQIDATKKSLDLRKALWKNRKSSILHEIKCLVHDCNDDSEGLQKLCRLTECAAAL
jgi:hypothetical protein